MSAWTGDGPCVCGWFHHTLDLTGLCEPAKDGGRWWELAPGQICPGCGEVLEWLHEPAPESLVLSLEAEVSHAPADARG